MGKGKKRCWFFLGPSCGSIRSKKVGLGSGGGFFTADYALEGEYGMAGAEFTMRCTETNKKKHKHVNLVGIKIGLRSAPVPFLPFLSLSPPFCGFPARGDEEGKQETQHSGLD